MHVENFMKQVAADSGLLVHVWIDAIVDILLP